MNKEEQFDRLIEDFLNDKTVDFSSVPDDLKNIFEVAILLKKGKCDSNIVKEKVFETALECI